MNLFDYIHASDRDTFINITSELLDDEKRRIVAQKLASQEEVNNLLEDFIKEVRHRLALGGTASSNDLAYIHRQLKSVVLPGDFEKIAGDFYDLSSLPKLKEKEDKLVYQVPAKKEPSEETLEQAEEELEKIMEQNVDDAKEKCGCGCEEGKCTCGPDCDCPHCSSEDEACDVVAPEEGSGPEGLSMMLISRLEDVVYKLGSQGRHSEAYKIEQTIRDLYSAQNALGKNEK